MKSLVWFLGLMVATVLVGCHGTASAPAAMTTKQYPIRGVVMSTDIANNEVELKHGAIPGLMEAMTMSYRVVDPSVTKELHIGDTISATLVAEQDAEGPINMRLKDIVIVAQGKPDYLPKVQYHVPAPGDTVPDFALLNQSGKKTDFQRLRGKVVVMTFIYTRCPLSDFCPRMSKNFAEIDKALESDASLHAKTHLLSVSFDPTYDTPKVLKSYGAAYTGRYAKETFDHWEFAAPSLKELPAMEQWFDVGVTPGDSGSLMHSLSTVVIGKDGKVVAFWPTNDWAVQDVMAKIKAAVS
jgi:protein SCO1/2